MLAALLAALLAAPAHDASGIRWIEDDYRTALAQAREQGKPLFVDIWATWCHSCLSMKRYVLTDPGMKPAAQSAIWLAVDQELPKNREFVSQHRVDGLPTFFLLDPHSGKVLSRWLGSGTVADMRNFVVHGRELLDASKGGKVAPALLAAQRGDAAQLADDKAAAAREYEAALQASTPDAWFRPQLVGKLLTAWRRVGTPEALKKCVQLGLAEVGRLGKSVSAADAASGAASCAGGLKDDPSARAVYEKAVALLTSAALDPKAEMSADDRSDALGTAAGLLEELGRKDEARKATDQRRDLLLAAQKSAPDAETASTFDAHLAEAYINLKQPEKAEALLAAREKEMPDDYNPPARRARALLEMGKAAEADAAIDRALKLAPKGPRKAGLLSLKEKIVRTLGRPVEPVLREQLELLESLPPTQRRPQAEAKLRARLGKKE